jgi:hypothetical protein
VSLKDTVRGEISQLLAVPVRVGVADFVQPSNRYPSKPFPATKVKAVVTETVTESVLQTRILGQVHMTSVEQRGPGPKRYETANELLFPLAAPQPGKFYNSGDTDMVDHSAEYTSTLLRTKTFCSNLAQAEPCRYEGVRHQLRDSPVQAEEPVHCSVADGLRLLGVRAHLHRPAIAYALLAAEPDIHEVWTVPKSFSSMLPENNLTRCPEDEEECVHLLV